MTPYDMCNWISGVLEMATTEDGGVQLTKTQYEKLRFRLDDVINSEPATLPPTNNPSPPNPSPYPSPWGNARC